MKQLFALKLWTCLILLIFSLSNSYAQDCDCTDHDVSFIVSTEDEFIDNCVVQITPVFSSTFPEAYWEHCSSNPEPFHSLDPEDAGTASDLSFITSYSGNYYLHLTSECCITLNVNYPYLIEPTCSVSEITSILPTYYWTFDENETIQFGNSDLDVSYEVNEDVNKDLFQARKMSDEEDDADFFNADAENAQVGGYLSSSNNAPNMQLVTANTYLPQFSDLDAVTSMSFEFLARIDIENNKTNFDVFRTTPKSGLRFGMMTGSYLLQYGFGYMTEDLSYEICYKSLTTNEANTQFNASDYYLSPVGSLNGWHHYAVTIDIGNDNMSLYIDGTLAKTGPACAAASSIAIGKTEINRSADGDTGGFLDEFAIYKDIVLSPELIYQHYLEAIQGEHYSFVNDQSSCNLPLLDNPYMYQSKEFPIGFMANEIISTTEDGVNTYIDGANLRLNATQYQDNIDPTTDQLSLYPLPRYAPDHSLRRNYPWVELEYLGGRRFFSGLFTDDEDMINHSEGIENYLSNGKNLMEEMATNWNYGIHLNSREAGAEGYDRWRMGHELVEFANSNPDIPLSVHLNWHSSAIQPYGTPNLFNGTLDPSNYYYNDDLDQPTGAWNYQGSPVPAWEDGRAQYLSRFNGPIPGLEDLEEEDLPPVTVPALQLLTRPINRINENGEINPELAQNHVSFSGFESSSDVGYYEWWNELAVGVTQFRQNYLEGFESGHQAFANADLSYYSVDGKGGHSGFGSEGARYPWNTAKLVLSELNYPEILEEGEDYSGSAHYSTADFYPFIGSWDVESGHGMKWMSGARQVEIAAGDKLCSPFVNPGWRFDPTQNMRPGQYLGLLKILGMMGAEFYYGTYFFGDGGISQNPKTLIWQFTTPSYAQAIMSKVEDHLYDGQVHGSIRADITNPSIYGTIRKLDASYLISCTLQRRSSQVGVVSAGISEDVAILSGVGKSTLRINARTQGSTYIYDDSNKSDIVFYQLDGWHEQWHPSWWDKGFSIEGELYEASSGDGNLQLTTRLFSEGTGLYDEIPLNSSSDFTNFLTHVESSGEKTVSYYFSPRASSPDQGEKFSYDFYLKAKNGNLDAESATAFIKIIDETQGNTIFSQRICLGGDWNWYKLVDACAPSDTDEILLQNLDPSLYRIDITLNHDNDINTDGFLLDQLYLSPRYYTDSYYNGRSYVYATEAEIEEKLFPEFVYEDIIPGEDSVLRLISDDSEVFVTQACPSDDIDFEVESAYCEGFITFANLSDQITTCTDNSFIWSLVKLVDGVPEDSPTATGTDVNFQHNFNIIDETVISETYRLTLTDDDGNELTIDPFVSYDFTIYNSPEVTLAPLTQTLVDGEEGMLTATMNNMGQDILSTDYSWTPDMWSTNSDLNSEILTFTAHNSLNEEYETLTTNYSVEVISTIDLGDDETLECTSHFDPAVVIVEPCEIAYTFNPELTGGFWNTEGTSNILYLYENPVFPLEIDNILIPLGDASFALTEIALDVDGDGTPDDQGVSVDENGTVTIDDTFNGYAVIQFEISDTNSSCVEEGYFTVIYENYGCMDGFAQNTDLGASDYPDNYSGTILNLDDVTITHDPPCNVATEADLTIGILAPSIDVVSRFVVFNADGNFNPISTAYDSYFPIPNDDPEEPDELVVAVPSDYHIEELPYGRYVIRIFTQYGCFYDINHFIYAPINVTIGDIAPVCDGANDGILTYTISHDLDYESEDISLEIQNGENWDQVILGGNYWEPVGTNLFELTGLSAGTYRLTVINPDIEDECAIITDPFEVPVLGATEILTTITAQPSCLDSSDGSLSVEITTGVGPYIYEWTSDLELPADVDLATLEGLSSGDYTITVSGSCGEPASETVTLSSNYIDLSTSISVASQPLCPNDATGEMQVEVTGGLAPYTYSWTAEGDDISLGAEETQNGLTSGSYLCTIIDACDLEDVTEVLTLQSQFTDLSVTTSITPPSDPNSSDGELFFDVSGGTGTYSYSFNDTESIQLPEGENTLTIIDLPRGEHTITITDDCGEYAETFVLTDACSELLDADFTFIEDAYYLVQAENNFDNGDYYFSGDMVFGPELEMTITGAIFCFQPDAELLIWPGANIEFINCTFTSCSHWAGMRLEIANQDPAATNEIISLRISDNSIIEYADNGIKTSNTIADDLLHVDLMVEDSEFLNNSRSINLKQVKKTLISNWPEATESLLNAFNNCSFEVNPSYADRGLQEFDSHLKFHTLKGFNLNDCKLRNTRTTETEWTQRGSGIYSDDALYKVTASQEDSDAALFEGLEYGINASVTHRDFNGMTVRDCNFIKNRVGIFNNNVCYQIIHRNHITLGLASGVAALDVNEPDPDCLIDCNHARDGIFLQGGAFFTVQENHINNAGAVNHGTIGIRVRDIKNETDVIRNNYLSNLTFGNMANGINLDTDPEEPVGDFNGLRYLCNENTTNMQDFIVAEFPNPSNASSGMIAVEQKDVDYSNLLPEDTPTGNILTDWNFANLNPLVGHFDHRGTQQVSYFHDDDLDPLVSNSNVTLDNTAPGVISCVPPYVPGIILEITDHEVVVNNNSNVISVSKADLDAVKYLYLSMIDDGDTETLKDEVEFAVDDDTWSMRENLLATSPFVSLKVAYKVADNTSTFPHPIAFEIFAANPDLLKNAKFINYLTKKSNPMPEYMVALLYEAKDETSFRTELLSQMNSLRIVIGEARTNIMNAYIHNLGDYESAYNIIEESNCTTCDMLLIEHALEKGNYTGAENYLASLNERQFVKDPASKTEITQYNRWYAIHKAAKQSSRSWSELSTAELSTLEDIALAYYFTQAGKRAISVLRQTSDASYFIPPALEGSDFEFRSFLKNDEFNSLSEVQVYPNPASPFVNIELDFSKSITLPTKFTVYDASGKEVYSKDISLAVDYFVINTAEWASGTYSYSLLGFTELLKTGKIEIAH